ncbi:hypothetical protein EUX98_g7124 [Antrodiella citrinella]|uniref:Peptidase A1 domain-containing protein n=2 Tax=Antrodiella citrinella TaxID=2447956 RepID=A0A4S4MMK7_9APHY|nr:hypothetical protein EUX98_g7124 [Antrodiella citrinella]
MFCKSSLITVALALLATASPIAQPEPVAEGITIALPKRSSLTKADGTFDHDRAIIQTTRTINKHRQNLINLKANRGEEAFNPGAEIKERAVLPEHLAKRQSESLTDQEDDTEWTGTISIGSNNQQFVIDFDTGSSDLWVPNASKCKDCTSKHTYNSATSKTSKAQSGTFSIGYADGSSTSGPIFTDDVTVAGILSTNQYLAAVTDLSAFSDDPLDGILGLAFQDISNLNAPPFFQNAFSEGAVPSGAFAFNLASTGSTLYLGGTDTSLYTGDVEYHDVTNSGFWQATGGSAVVAGKTVVSDFQTVIDSGTTIMYGPAADVKKFYAAIPGSTEYDTKNAMYSFPCDAVPDVAFNWGGKDWAITADNFNLGTETSGSSQCVGALSGQDLGLGAGVWLLGDSFMKNVYTVFDVSQNAVGFAELK